MITSTQRSYLRSLANGIDPIFQVGKDGIGENLIRQFDDALEARELVKARVLRSAGTDAREVCREVAEKTGAEVVQVIGSKFVLYRESAKKSIIL